MNKIYVTTMSEDYFKALGFKTLQSWLKNCNDGTVVLYSEDFTPYWTFKNNITHWDDSYYDRLVVKPLKLNNEWQLLHNQLTGRAKNFVWKAYTWISAVNDFKGVVTFFDADLICFQNPNAIIEQFINNQYDASILSVKDVRPHADSCFYSVNTELPSASLIAKEYANQYLNYTSNVSMYPKPYDAPVFARTLDLLKTDIKIWDFNPGSDAKSPLKDTILTDFFRHLKGNQKDAGKILELIDKTINALDKGKNVQENLIRFDRKLRQDDSKKLDVPF
jgi:hypothetical protein